MKNPTRRKFLQTSSGAVLAGAATPALAPAHAFVGGDDVLRVGLIGCGGRGSGAAVQALRADPNTRLVALGDTFDDRIQRSLNGLMKTDVAERVDVPQERQFADFDCFEKVLGCDLDVVLLATPPHFRPQHLRAAIEHGVHVFCEKPVAVDAPGVRSVRETCELAKRKELAIVSGLCYRYHDGRRAIMQEIHDGRIGEILSLEANYITGELWHRGENPEWSEMEFQVRNWLYYPWLSGDLIAEQHIHSLDVMAWALQDTYPVACVSLGGRQKRTDPKFGVVYDHFATRYEFPDGIMGYSYCRQQNGCARDVSDHITGTQGKAHVFQHRIEGAFPWRLSGKPRNMYQNEHDAMFASIRSGELINNGDYMCNSTLMAIMGRMAAYTGQRITWEQAAASTERLGPQKYEWGDVETAPVAIPGITKFS